jgi:hypothetical protein
MMSLAIPKKGLQSGFPDISIWTTHLHVINTNLLFNDRAIKPAIVATGLKESVVKQSKANVV